jgi:hypothetical protein
MSSSRAGPVPSLIAVRSMITAGVLVAAAGVAPHVLVDPDDTDTVEASDVVDQRPLALGQNGVIGGVPGDCQTLGDPGDGQVLHHDALQRPPQTTTRQLRSRFGRLGGVLAPHVTAARAPVAADGDFERRGSPPERLVGQPPDHGVARCPFAAAAAAPVVGFDHPAGEHRSIGFDALPDGVQAELVESAERGQVRASEGSVVHVEVFRMDGVRTSILGRPRRLSPDRRASRRYTLIWEEPVRSTMSHLRLITPLS